MKVKVWVVLVVSVFVLTLVACGDKKEAKTEEKTTTAKVEEKQESPAAQSAAEPQPAQETAAAEVMLLGTVDASGKFVAEDGQAYTIADNDMGKELAKLVSKKVELKGTVAEKEGAKTVTVLEYKEIK